VPEFPSKRAVAYAWRELSRRVGVGKESSNPFTTGFENLGVSVCYGRPDEVQFDGPGIIVVPRREATWWSLLAGEPGSLKWLSADKSMPAGVGLPIGDSIPVLFWGEGHEAGDAPFAESRPDGTVVFYADIVAAALFMLTRWEETVVLDRDEHERFPGTASVAYKQGFLDRPIVDEYAMILREWLRMAVPSWRPRAPTFSVELSHDVDWTTRFPSWYSALRAFGGDLLKRRDPRRAWRTAAEAITQAIAPDRAQYFAGIHSLARISREFGMGNDVFYFMCADQGPLANDYDLASPRMRRLVEQLRQQGFEIGFHPGYQTLNDPQRMAEEKARFEDALGLTNYGGRQHYLRFCVPNTWRDLEGLGLAYDSTMTYADQEGFRCGTCYPFRPFDIDQDREMDLLECPLIVMDSTLCNYRGFTPGQTEARVLQLASRCRRVGGTFTLLWHASSVDENWYPDAPLYRRLVGMLSTMVRQQRVGP